MNYHNLSHPERLGSAGLPLPGFALTVVDEAGNLLPVGQQGILAVIRNRSPLFFFPGYIGREGQDWIGDYYLTGDTVELGEDGAFSFVGRSDDVISSAGYRIGPFDVESSLIEHAAVFEFAVVGKPDAERGQIVKAFVVLSSGYSPSDALGGGAASPRSQASWWTCLSARDRVCRGAAQNTQRQDPTVLAA
jgi:acetyl-CoA synthetase